MMKSKYTVYAEYVSIAAMDMMAEFFRDYDHTITTGLGAYAGIQEESMRMDIIMMSESCGDRESLLRDIKTFEARFCAQFNQVCVFVTRSVVEIITL